MPLGAAKLKHTLFFLEPAPGGGFLKNPPPEVEMLIMFYVPLRTETRWAVFRSGFWEKGKSFIPLHVNNEQDYQ